MTDEDERPDLTVFIEDTERHRQEGRRILWKDRRSLIQQHFPTTAEPQLGERLTSDSRVYAALLHDILHSIQTQDGKEGRKPNFNPEQGADDYRILEGVQYSVLPFAHAFRELARDRASGRYHSRTEIARKTNISRTRVHRLLVRAEPPSIEDLVVIARAYGKPSSYFTEYRSRFVAQHLASVLDNDPDLSHSVYQQIVGER